MTDCKVNDWPCILDKQAFSMIRSILKSKDLDCCIELVDRKIRVKYNFESDDFDIHDIPVVKKAFQIIQHIEEKRKDGNKK
jgi:hypothetical protein